MKNAGEWNTFMRTGSVEDYLRYTGAYVEKTTNVQRTGTQRKAAVAEEIHAESDNGYGNDYQIRAE